ncbi:uncharacterized protein RSE6_02512 [Rhynchosporium secalis]|uniref:Uncharacterized protein n=1 Tax=Rhynchosporium secalis TaxID=38038 RepID=A0A1E1M0E5_RHYSE|nr:uncharacterized protein RSE6_02512 [Rhynchosporium secalis]
MGGLEAGLVSGPKLCSPNLLPVCANSTSELTALQLLYHPGTPLITYPVARVSVEGTTSQGFGSVICLVLSAPDQLACIRNNALNDLFSSHPHAP